MEGTVYLQIGVPDFLVPAAIIAVTYFFARTRLMQSRNSVALQFAVVFVLGCTSFVLPFLLRTGDPVLLKFEDAATAGAEWVVFLWLVRRFSNLFAKNAITTAVCLIALIWLLEIPVAVLLSDLYETLVNQDLAQIARSPGTLSVAIQGLATYPYNLLDLLDAIAFVGVVYCLGLLPVNSMQTERTRFWLVAHGGVIRGYQDMEMSPSSSHTTRLLCASALMGGNREREKVLEFLTDPNRAVAPELGTDLRLVAQITKFAAERHKKFQWYFFVCVCAALLGALIDTTLGISVLIVTGASIAIIKAWPEHFIFPRLFAKHVYDPEAIGRRFHADLAVEEAAGLPIEDQNLVVYQGFSPFVGAGTGLGGWSFIVNVGKGKEELGCKLDPREFKVRELYDEIVRSIETLRLQGLSQRDMYFAHGSDIRDDRTILPDAHSRPVQRIDPVLGGKYRDTNDPHIRHYKWIRVMDWGNELTTSYFLRCSLRGSHLFVEINRFLMTPLAASYRKVDSMGGNVWQQRVGIVLSSVVSGPLNSAFSILSLLGSLQEFIQMKSSSDKKQRRKLIDENPQFNYGVAKSYRDVTCSDQFMHYFQKLDGDFYTKVLEQEILTSITSFLDDRNIDTSELKERQATILNSGIIIQSGDVKAESLAVGAGAQATKVSKAEPAGKSRFRRATEQTS
jgi:hypothetical protein